MAGERYSHSLDIGEELEREKEEEKKGEQQPLPCFCSPKIRPKASEEQQEENKERQEKKEEPAPESETKEDPMQEKEEKQNESPAEQEEEQKFSEASNTAKESVPEQKQEHSEEPRIEVRSADLSDESGWEKMEDVAPAEPQRPCDPVEEDVNAIITKEVPVLHPGKSIFECLLERKSLLIFVFVALVAGVFLAWKLVLPEPLARGLQFEPSDAFVPANTTLFPVQDSEVPVISSETPEIIELPEQLPPEPAELVEMPDGLVVGEVIPAAIVVQANSSSVDELPEVLAQQLRD